MRPDANKTQLPPRPWDMPTDDKDVYELIASKAPEERRLIDNLFKKYADVAFQAIANCDEMRRCLKHVEAENESLKAKLGQCYILTGADPDIDADEPWRLAPYAVREVKRLREESDEAEAERDKYKNEANQLRLAFVLSDAILPAEFEPTLPPTKRLHVYINKALEVIREYREDKGSEHHYCRKEVRYPITGMHDDRCPTCIKADELLKVKEEEIGE